MWFGTLRAPGWFAHFFFLNDTATPEIYPLPLHDALPISLGERAFGRHVPACRDRGALFLGDGDERMNALELRRRDDRPEIGRAPSELQSQSNLVCRLLLEKKKTTQHRAHDDACILSCNTL